MMQNAQFENAQNITKAHYSFQKMFNFVFDKGISELLAIIDKEEICKK